jgi:hypothetical protein
MDDAFYSKPNFYLLKSVACKAIQKKYNYTIRDEYDNIITKVMEQTNNKVPACPSHIEQQVYTKELNKKVLDIIVFNIHKKINKRVVDRPVQPVHPPINRSMQEMTDDRNREMAKQIPDPVDYNNSRGNYKNNLDYPAVMQNTHTNSDINRINQYASNQLINDQLASNSGGSTNISNLHGNNGIAGVVSPLSQTYGYHSSDNNVLEKNQTNDINTNMNNYPTTNTDQNLYTNQSTDIETNTNNYNIHMNNNNQNNNNQNNNQNNNNNQNIVDLEKNVNYTLERNNQILIESSDAPHKLFHDINTKNELNRINQIPQNVSHSYPIITPTRTKQIERFEYITIDSRDRDLSRFPNTNHFEIKFSPTSDSFDVPTFLDKHGLVKWGSAVKYHGDDKGASIGVNYNNILSVECVQGLFPGEPQPAWGVYPRAYKTQADVTEPFGIDYTASGGDIGILTSIFDESYLLLHVEELDGPYRGTSVSGENAFTKLIHDGLFGTTTPHIQMKPVDGEYKLYTPTTLGKLNKMTVRLHKHNNLLFNFGNDKTYISTTEINNIAKINYCPDDTAPAIDFTEITINKVHNDYNNGCISGHGLKPGDLIYIYSTIPHEHNFTLTNNNLVFTKSGTDTIEGSVTFNGEDTIFDANTLLNIGDFIKYNSTISRISAIDKSTNDITISGDLTNEPATTSNFGFYKVNKRGQLNDQQNALNYIDGVRVITVTDSNSFTINFPFNSLNNLLKTSHSDPLLVNELFFIKKKMQVSYTFKVITLEKDYEPIKSDLNQ